MRKIRPMVLGGVLLVATSRPWLPLPPPLPTDPPTDRAAPVPDDNVPAPPSGSAGSHSSVAVEIYQMREYNTGDGYIPGSAYESPEARRPLQPPGFMVTVPLQ
ncbi:MAG TPA: hypothetical protein VMU81_19400 [Acetobacteraceae bacterium]|jgi:hypothetical protein|nr:hypothetical protein [Acetobacteraceae bacterium]